MLPPNGAAQDPNAPSYACFPSQDVSPCCGLTGFCTNTGLCVPGSFPGDQRDISTNLIRGLCTDSTWKSEDCPLLCTDASTDGTNLISCANVMNNDRDFCCDHTVGCCDSRIGRFRLDEESLVVAIGEEGTTSLSNSASRTSAAATSSQSASASETGAKSSSSRETTSRPGAASTTSLAAAATLSGSSRTPGS
jgi:hypothetical protein